MAAQHGDTVNIPIPSAIAVQSVSAAATPPSTADIVPTSATISLNQWFEAPFYLTDKDMLDAIEGVIPMQLSEAIRAMANKIDATIYALYPGVYGYNGTFNPIATTAVTATNTTPFATSVIEYTRARTTANKQLAPVDNRRVVLNPDAEGNALGLTAFQSVAASGSNQVIMEGQIGHKIGADWYMSQNVPTHVSTNPSAGAGTVTGVNAVGATTIGISKATNPLVLVAGDIIQIAGDAQTYAIVTTTTVTTTGNIVITPGLKKATVGAEALSMAPTHVVNLLFHRDAFAFASRPLLDVSSGLGNQIESAVDPISGVALRLEVSREHKRTRFSLDALWGAGLIRPELAVRLPG
jgi:hypothetical protein